MVEPYTLEKYKKARKAWTRVKMLFFAILFFIFLAGAGYLVFLSPVTTGITYRIEGAEEIVPEDFNEVAPMIFSFRLPPNILFTDEKEAEVFLLKKYPRLASVEVAKDVWRRSVEVRAQERKKEIIWCGKTECYWIDTIGVVFEQAPYVEGLIIPKIEEPEREGFALGEEIIDRESLEKIIRFSKMLNDHGIKWSRIELKARELYEVWFFVDRNTSIRVSLRNATQEVFNAFFELLKNMDMAKIDYFDMTAENRIYYKQR